MRYRRNIQEKRTRKIWIAGMIVLSVLLAFAGDWLVGHFKMGLQGSRIFMNASDAFDIFGCEIINNEVVITSTDPQFAVKAPKGQLSAVRILFSEPVAQDTDLQVFYSVPNEYFNEELSRRTTIMAGSKEAEIRIHKGEYNNIRFDFEANVKLKEITIGNIQPVLYPDDSYKPDILRIILFSAETAALLIILLLGFTEWKENIRLRKTAGEIGESTKDESIQAKHAAIKTKKPFMLILACNLFLTLTVVFFQPLMHGIVNIGGFPYGKLWGTQLAIAISAAFILSGLMVLLPARGGIVAASIPLGAGIAFLVQSLLLNDGKPFAMNTNWPTEVENVFIWFFIVATTFATAAYYCGQQSEQMKKGMCVIACVLIILQAMNFTILGTTQDKLQWETPNQQIATDEIGFSELMEISMYRGMPYLIKDSFNAPAAE